jgi:Amino acid synthesis
MSGETNRDLGLRKQVTYCEDVFIESGKPGGPLRVCAVAAVIANPWAGRGFVEDLQPEILRIAPQLALSISSPLIDMCGGPDGVAAFGKAAVVGSNGEIEHASALIHTLRFGNVFRDAVKGKSFLSFTNTRGGLNTPICIPITHKDDEGLRSHYLTLQFSIADAPGPDEIVVALAASTGGRLHARIGNRYEDKETMALSI